MANFRFDRTSETRPRSGTQNRPRGITDLWRHLCCKADAQMADNDIPMATRAVTSDHRGVRSTPSDIPPVASGSGQDRPANTVTEIREFLELRDAALATTRVLRDELEKFFPQEASDPMIRVGGSLQFREPIPSRESLSRKIRQARKMSKDGFEKRGGSGVPAQVDAIINLINQHPSRIQPPSDPIPYNADLERFQSTQARFKRIYFGAVKARDLGTAVSVETAGGERLEGATENYLSATRYLLPHLEERLLPPERPA